MRETIPPIGSRMPPKIEIVTGSDLRTGHVWVVGLVEHEPEPFFALEGHLDTQNGAIRFAHRLGMLIRRLSGSECCHLLADRLELLEARRCEMESCSSRDAERRQIRVDHPAGRRPPGDHI